METMRSTPIRFLALFAVAAATSAVFGADAKREEAQAQILEQEKFPCVNCFFGPSQYYFCFSANDKVILAYDSIPTFNWTDGSKNYFGKVHNSWKSPTPAGQALTIQYDDKHVWIPRADGKQIRLKLDSSHDIFTDPRCRAAVKKPAGN
jgi:hypothetical protein